MSRSGKDGRRGGGHRKIKGIAMPRIVRDGEMILDTWAEMNRPDGKRFAKGEASGARRRVGRRIIERSLRETEDA